MEESTDFTTLLRDFMTRAHRTPNDLAQLTGLSINTLKNWTGGVVRRPRVMNDVLKLARALALDAAETSALLTAAGHPPLTTLQAQAQQTGDSALRTLLAAWPIVPAPDPATAALPGPSPPQSPRHQLRAPVTDFVGRAQKIDQLMSAFRLALAEERGAIISGVQGMGGIGKTELAYIIAHHLRESFPDAQLVLNLRGSSATPLTPEQTLQAVIHTLTPDARLPDELPALEQHYRTLLHNSRMLILADDARDAVQVQALMPPAGSAVLITSRQRFILAGMATVQLEHLQEDEAAVLLRAICPRLGAAEADLIARACGYLPLALRISGGILHTTPALAVASYIARLGDERQRLIALRDPDDPQLNVEASLRLSYAQLDDTAQQVFRQLGVLVADFDRSLARAVVVVPGGRDIEATLQRLLRRNLVMYDAEQARWRLHDLVRDLARDTLEVAGELEAVAWRYARAAVQIVQAAEADYTAGGTAALEALARYDTERPHIDAGRHWAALHVGTPDSDQLLLNDAVAMRSMSMLRHDRRRQHIPQFDHAHAVARRLGDQRADGLILINLANAYAMLGEPQHAILYYDQALTIARTIGDQHSEGTVLINMGNAYTDLGDFQRALPYSEQALTISRALDNRLLEAGALDQLGTTYFQGGDSQRAILYHEQALTIARETGDQRTESMALNNLANAYAGLGDAQRAVESCYYEQALVIARELRDEYTEGDTLSRLAYAMATVGDAAHGTTLFGQALAILEAIGDRHGVAECRWHYGLFLAQQGARTEALPLLRAAVAYEEEIGHAKATEHAALLARLEVGEPLPADLVSSAGQRAVGEDGDAPPDANVQP